MKQINIWSEGYIATGERSSAILLSIQQANDFDEAVEKYIATAFKKEEKTIPHRANRNQFISDEAFENRRTNWYFWGCALFDNESDARKSFG
jgi:hypothetical protein